MTGMLHVFALQRHIKSRLWRGCRDLGTVALVAVPFLLLAPRWIAESPSVTVPVGLSRRRCGSTGLKADGLRALRKSESLLEFPVDDCHPEGGRF